MGDLVESSQQEQLPERVESPGACQYCSAPLHPGFYFCLACATPYKSSESLLAHLKPIPPTDSELVAAKAPQVKPLFLAYACVLVGSAVLGVMLFGFGEIGLRILISDVALFVTTCVFAAMYWPSLKAQFKRFGFLHWAAYAGIAALALLLVVNYGYSEWVKKLLGGNGSMFSEMREALGRGGMIFLFCVLPAVIEEIAFRGLVQHWLQTAISPLKAMLLASALFTALHGSLLGAPYLFMVGMLLGWAKWKTGSLYPSMVIHFLHNFVVIEYFNM